MADKLFEQMENNIKSGVVEAMDNAGAAVCKEMSKRLISDGHVDTGHLVNDMMYSVENNGDDVTVDVYIAYYGKYIDSGTGKRHGVPNGRDHWRYKDRYGEWHYTTGMTADPFIDESVNAVVENLTETIGDRITAQLSKRIGGERI
jgi:hypothetical protein